MAVRPGGVHVGAGSDQDLRRLAVAVTRHEQQRREPDRRPGLHVGTCGDQLPHDVPVALGGRPHQRGLPRRGNGRRDADVARKQRPHDLDLPGPGGHHQGRHAVRLGGMGVGTRGQELRNHRGTRVFARERQRGHPLVLGDVDVGAGRQQQIRGVQVVPMRGPQQCGRTIGAHRVHIDTLTQERAHRRPVLGLDGGDEPQIGLRRARTAGHRQERREQQTAETTRGHLPMLPFSRGSLTSR